MSDTTTSSDQDAQKHWEPWIQDWQFSNHAVFRIPSYLDSMMRDWRQQSPLLIAKAFEPEPFYFFRHPLTGDTKLPNRHYTPLIRFAQSVFLTRLLSPSSNVNEITRDAGQSIKQLITELKNQPSEWQAFLRTIKEQPGFHYLEEEIKFQLLEELSNSSREIADTDIPEVFHHLFLAFCSVGHRGYLQQRLNECHWSLQAQDRDKILGYCLQLSPEADSNKLAPIQWIRKLHWGGSWVTPILSKSQPHAYELFGQTDSNDNGSVDLLLKMFRAVNGPSSFHQTEAQYLVAVPVYEWSAPPILISNGNQVRYRGGALLGWVLNRLPRSVELAKVGWARLAYESGTLTQRHRLYRHLRSLSFLAETFASKFMNGETEWALERDWKNEDTARSYMERYFFHSCSWACSFDLKGIEDSDLKHAKDGYFHRISERRLLVNLSKSSAPNDSKESGDPVIAVLTPTIHYLEPDTSVANEHFTCIAEHARFFYRDRVLPRQQEKEAARLLGEGSGKLKSAHDYSKDLNVLDGLVGKVLEEVAELEQQVDGLLDKPEAKESAADGFARLHRIKEALNLRNRFLMAHERTISQARFYPQPEWCVNLVKSGYMKDLDELVRLLVWQPLGWVRYQDLAVAGRRKDLSHSEVSEWSRLFAYDERGANPGIDRILGDYLLRLFAPDADNRRPDVSEKWGINHEEFGRLHPPPLLNEHQGFEKCAKNQILWSPLSPEQLGKRWLPAAELLPLLVFSLRAAFQHAWLRTFLDAAGGSPGIAQHIQMEAKDEPHFTGHYSIYGLHLDFPSPTPPPNGTETRPEGSVDLPWGDWLKQMDHYAGKVRPWKRWEVSLVGKVSPHPELQSPASAIHNDVWHYRISIFTGV